MGVYIKGMKMPTNCSDCPMCYDMMECAVAEPIINFFREELKKFDFCTERHPRCPLVSIEPVVRGKWIDRDDDYYGWNMWACSACGEEFVLTEGTPDMNDYHFCPNCGADMREE